MNKLNKVTAAMSLALCATASLNAGAKSLKQNSWSATELRTEIAQEQLNSKASKSSLYRIDITQFESQLYNHEQVLVDLPLPDGRFVTFKLTRSNVMSPELAQKYPSIRTFDGVQLGNPNNRGSFDISPKGFHGVFSIGGEKVYVDPVARNNKSLYHSYFRRDAQPLSESAAGLRQAPRRGKADSHLHERAAKQARPSENQMTTLKMAVATTGEYGAYHGGTKESVLAALVTMVNRLNDVYRVDMGLQFELVGNADAVIYTDPATDPFENVDDDIDKVQAVVDEAIGADTYDIGHIVTTGGGGLAGLGVVCGQYKAEGLTGSGQPTGDPFWIDYVAHEVGHQLGAEHTFNGSAGACNGNRSGSSAYEPGSASTIMGYAGICDDQDLQRNSDAFFHVHSVDQMTTTLSNAGESCGTTVALDNNAPVVDAGSDYTIPAKTPFELIGSATDPNGDAIVYSWEQMDLGPETTSAEDDISDDGQGPLFRSFLPTSEPVRVLPKLSSLIKGEASKGEALPTVDRELNFRLVARDSKGNLAYDGMKITVKAVEEGFSVVQPGSWHGTTQVATWNTAGTENAPVSCANVDILLSTDGGNTFTHELAKATANDGSEEVGISGIETEQARLKIKCADNIFFALTAQNFAINSGSGPVKPVFSGQDPISVNEDESVTIAANQLKFANNQIVDQLTLTAGDNYTVEGLTITPAANFNGELSVNASARAGTLDSDGFTVKVTVVAQNDLPVAEADAISINQGAAEQTIDVLSNDSDIEGDTLTLASFDYQGSGTVSISDNKLVYKPAADFHGTEKVSYTINDGNQGTATAEVTVTVAKAPEPTPTPTPTPTKSGGGSLWALLLLMAGALPSRIKRQ